MSARADRRGFALPMALLALALITATVVAAFAATNAETVANNAVRAQDRAYQLAETGLQQFLQRRNEAGFCTNCVNSPPPTDSEWTRVSLTGGYATVVATRVRAPRADGTPALFLVRSTGVDTTIRLSGAGRLVFATRTVGMYATWGTASMKALAVWTSLNGVTQSGTVPGAQVAIDATSDPCNAPRAGVAVPTGQFVDLAEDPKGVPPVLTNMTRDSLAKAIGVDWDAIRNRDAIPADFTIPPNPWPSPPDVNSTWPVVRVKTSLTISGDGRGLLIADSNVTFTGGASWDGVVLVGGTLITNGSGTLSGAIVSGLNRSLPGAPLDAGISDNDLNSSRTKFRYNSCWVTKAAQRLDMYFALTNAWMDNLAVW